MYAAEEEVSIYDGAPIEGIISPDEDNPEERDVHNSFDAVNAQVRHTHRGYSQTEDWQIIPDKHQVQTKEDLEKVLPSLYNIESPSDEGGPLQGELRKWVQERISWHTGSVSLLHLRSWWSILNNGVAVPRHSHTYQTKKKTVSGILWTKGDICPLFVKSPGSEINQINNVPGRCVVFSSQTEHWTEPYPHKTTRAGISFDFLIQDQECCDCVEDQVCYRCVHLTKNLRKVGINTIFTGGSTTVKYEVGDALVKNPLLNTLPKSYK
tara:strand:- start:4467 stop:5264 length:798 start_codon:yes stop_codon:yes gene_type:complete